MLQGEHSAILSTFIKLPFVIKIFILSIFEWQFYTGFTTLYNNIYTLLTFGFMETPLNTFAIRADPDQAALARAA